jgi:hypothetical protein
MESTSVELRRIHVEDIVAISDVYQNETDEREAEDYRRDEGVCNS